MTNVTGPIESRKKETIPTYFLVGGGVLAATFWLALVSYGVYELMSQMLWAQ